MPVFALPLDVAFLSLTLIAISWLLLSRKNKDSTLLPGPKPLPVIGNLLDIPSKNAHLVYHDWSRKYGSDLVQASIFNTNIVVIDTARAADELFNKRSALYSDRPVMTAACTYLGIDRTLGLMPYGSTWRNMRKAFHAHFHQHAVRAFEPIEERAVHELLRALLHTPESFREHLRHMAGNVIMRIAYGIDVHQKDDSYIALAEDAMAWFNRASEPGPMLLDMFPILQRMPSWIPGAGFKKLAPEGRKIIDELLERPWLDTKTAMEQGKAQPSVAASLIEDSDPVISQTVPGSMYMAGADSTVSALQSFFLAMLVNPAAQKKAQAELDAMLGGARLPTFADQDALPYTSALVREVLRWHPVAPLGVPHRLVADDVYKGHRIPAGATVFGNIWAILHDPTIFPDAESFRPEHFLCVADGGTLPADAPAEPEAVVFGFGRRVCPGRYMAHASLWSAIANILATFEIAPVAEVRVAYTDGVVSYPEAFECKIRVRSEGARAAVLATGG